MKRGGPENPSGLWEICVFFPGSSNGCKSFFFSTNLKVMVYRSILVRGESIQIEKEAWGSKIPSGLCKICAFCSSYFQYMHKFRFFSTNLKAMVSRSKLVRGKAFR